MRFLVQLRHACKLTNLTYPHKNSLSYASVAGSENQPHNRCYGCKPLSALKNEDDFQEAFALVSLLRDYNRQVEFIPHTKNNTKKDGQEEKDTSSQNNETFLTDPNDLNKRNTELPHDETAGTFNTGIDSSTYFTSSNPINLEQDGASISNVGFELDPKLDITFLEGVLLNPSNLPSSSTKTDDLGGPANIVSSNINFLSANTFPLHLNTFINGTTCLKKFQSPDYNEYLTALTSNLCNAALQKGLQTESCRKSYSTDRTSDDTEIIDKLMKKYDNDGKNIPSKNSSADEIVRDILDGYDKFLKELNTMAALTAAGSSGKNQEPSKPKRDPHIICVREGTKGCISPGLAGLPPFIPKKIAAAEEPSTTKELSSGLRLLDSKLYQKALKEAEAKRKRVAETSSPYAGNVSKLKSNALQGCQERPKIKDPCKSVTLKTPASISVESNKSLAGEPSLKCDSKNKSQTSKTATLPTIDNPCSPPKTISKTNLTPATIKTEPRQCSQFELNQKFISLKGSVNSQHDEKPVQKCSSKFNETDESEFGAKEKSPTLVSSSEDQPNPCKVQAVILKKQPDLPTSGDCSKKEDKSTSPMTSSTSFWTNKPDQSESKEAVKISTAMKCDSMSKTKDEAEKEVKDRCKALTFGSKTNRDSCRSTSKSKAEAKKENKKDLCKTLSSKSESKGDAAEKSSSASKCHSSSQSKAEATIEDSKNPCKTLTPESKTKAAEKPSASKCRCASKTKIEGKKRDFKGHCKKSLSRPASKCRSQTHSTETESKNLCKKSSKSSCSSKSTRKEMPKGDALKACKRAAKEKCSSKQDTNSSKSDSTCGSESKSLCKSSCDSMSKPKAKCGRPPRADTKPKCKKGAPCGDSKVTTDIPCKKSPSKAKCVPKTEAQPLENTSSKTKCGQKSEDSSSVSKCCAKACAPSPQSSTTEFKQPPKSGCTPTDAKPPNGTGSNVSKKGIHTLARPNSFNLILTRKYSDDCPKKPKGGYKPETERSDEYRRETCENYSWKSDRPKKKQTKKPKNCYPDETKEFCPDTACYRVYRESSGKADKKKGKKKPKANSTELSKESKIVSSFQLLNLKSFLHKQSCRLFSKASANQEALVEKPYKICTREQSDLEVSENDALIAVDSVALSDTDIYMFETGGKHTPGLTLGNEAAGVVQEVGKNVSDLKAGDHVVIESGIACGECNLCKSGRYNICPEINIKGCLRKCCVHPVAYCHKISKAIPMEEAALVHQLALGCNACQKANIKPNSNIVIIGSCAMTVCAAMSALSLGSGNICVMCGMPETKVIIEQFVTEKVNCYDSRTTDKGILRMILASLGTFPDIVINCSCSSTTMNAAIMALRPGGTCIISGFLSECVCFDIISALTKEIQLLPCFRSNNMYPLAIHLLESERTPIQCLIASCSKWNKLECAFKRALAEGNNGPRKAIVKCQIDD